MEGQTLLPKHLLEHLDYALIVATKPLAEGCPTKKKRVAIIGSGLAGLSAAHYLLTSDEAADTDVDVYEANDRPGLAGHTELIGLHVQLLQELDIPTAVVRTDSSFYGDDGCGNYVCYGYGQSSLANTTPFLSAASASFGGWAGRWASCAARRIVRGTSGRSGSGCRGT